MSAISTALLTLPMMANADVLASVKPLGFITSSIANGVTDTQVLVPAGASPHDYSLKLFRCAKSEIGRFSALGW